MLCIMAGGRILALATTVFTLSWTHSVERIEWRESWRIVGDRLHLVEATVEGPGAGIALPGGARMTPQGWVFKPALPPLRRLVLAASGTTLSGWTLCTDSECHELGSTVGKPIELWAAACEAAER
jgi:hypothetical protein